MKIWCLNERKKEESAFASIHDARAFNTTHRIKQKQNTKNEVPSMHTLSCKYIVPSRLFRIESFRLQSFWCVLYRPIDNIPTGTSLSQRFFYQCVYTFVFFVRFLPLFSFVSFGVVTVFFLPLWYYTEESVYTFITIYLVVVLSVYTQSNDRSVAFWPTTQIQHITSAFGPILYTL